MWSTLEKGGTGVWPGAKLRLMEGTHTHIPVVVSVGHKYHQLLSLS